MDDSNDCKAHVQITRLRSAVDSHLLFALLDHVGCTAVAHRLAELRASSHAAIPAKAQRARDRVRAARASAFAQAAGSVSSIRDLHRLTKEKVKDMFGGDPAVGDAARAALAQLQGMSAEQRLAVLEEQAGGDESQVRPIVCLHCPARACGRCFWAGDARGKSTRHSLRCMPAHRHDKMRYLHPCHTLDGLSYFR